jgi:SAM-dependent methyltransferase
MGDMLTRFGPAEWTSVLADVGLDWGSNAVIVGDQALDVAGSYLRAGAPPLVFESPDFAVLSKGPAPDFAGNEPSAFGLAPDSMDLVVLRNAWRSLPEMTDVIWNAHRITKPGGGLLACEFDVDRALTAPATRYPSQVLYAAHPELVEHFRSLAAGTVDISVEMGRAGYADVRKGDVDETRGRFDEADALFYFVAVHGWRGMERLEPRDATEVLDRLADLLPRLAPSGVSADREPWIWVRGTKPA